MTFDRQMQGNVQAQTVALPKRLPLVIEPSNRTDATNKDAKLLNAYMERNDKTGETWIFKRPGLTQVLTTKSGNGLGVYNFTGSLYAIFGTKLYNNDTDTTSVISTTGGVYKFCRNMINELQNGVSEYLAFNNGVNAYAAAYGAFPASAIIARTTVAAGAFVVGQTYTIATLGTTNFTLIGSAFNIVGWMFVATGAGAGTGTAYSDTNFPWNAVKGLAYLDGTFYATSVNASVRGCSTLNDPFLWTDPLNRLTAQIEPDKAVFTAKQLTYVIVGKEWTTEVFYDQKNATGSPLGPVQGAKINYGCVSADSVQDIDGALCWLCTTRAGSVQVLVLEALKPRIVSTPAIELILDAATFTNIFSLAFKYNGHTFYVITLKDSNITLVYDLREDMWAQWTDTNGNYWPMVSATFNSTQDVIVQHETNGKLYKLDASVYLEDGAEFTTTVVTPNFDGGTRRRKTLATLEFVADTVTGSKLSVRSNDNDYALGGWSNFRYVDLGVKRPLLYNCGTFVRRAYELSHRANLPFRLQALEMQIDLGTL